jgi:hypothetical protein
MPRSVIEMFEINENQVYQLRGSNINSPLESHAVTSFMKEY